MVKYIFVLVVFFSAAVTYGQIAPPPPPPLLPAEGTAPEKPTTSTGTAITSQGTITTDLSMGMSNEQVTTLQQILKTGGYFTAEVTGYFGTKTYAAVVAYQQANGIPGTGYVGPKTRAALAGNSGTVDPPPSSSGVTMDLKYGMQHTQVKILQQKLIDLGYLSADTTPTGFFGVKTKASVIAFQLSQSLPTTGFVGPLTRAALLKPDTTVPPLPPLPHVTNALLRYKVLHLFSNIFYCDPDYFPIVRGDEKEFAKLHFSQIQANADTYALIVHELNIDVRQTLTDEHKLSIYKEYKKISSFTLELNSKGSYNFAIRTGADQSAVLHEGTITASGVITIIKETPFVATCPR
jgi:peptidoglycan hydrolase-like protein with peptidoglycan-binding domain